MCGGLGRRGAFGRLKRIVPAYIETVFVLESFRSKGIGKRLYDYFIKWCKESKVNKIMLDVSTKNRKAIKFYRKNNFKDYSLTLETDL